MSTAKKTPLDLAEIPSALANCLGVRRTMTLRRVVRQSGLPLEAVLDLALELLDIASQYRIEGLLTSAVEFAHTRKSMARN